MAEWISVAKSELLTHLPVDGICDEILKYTISFPVLVKANEDSVSDIIAMAKKMKADKFTGNLNFFITLKDRAFSKTPRIICFCQMAKS